MYYLIGIKHPFSEAIDILDKNTSYDVLAQIQKIANIALTSDDPYPLKYKQFRIVDSIDNFKRECTEAELGILEPSY